MIERAVTNPVFSHLALFAIVAVGLVSLASMPTETFSNIEERVVLVRVVIPGAGPADIEEGVLVPIEQAVAGTDGVEEIESQAVEGLATVSIHLEAGAGEVQPILESIRERVNRVDLPREAERPVVERLRILRPMGMIAIHGEHDVRDLENLAHSIRDDLIDLPEVSEVTIKGPTESEIRIEIRSEDLVRLGLSLEEVVDRVRASSIDLSAGSLRTENEVIRVRTADRRRHRREFEDLILAAGPDGGHIRLGEVARVVEDYVEDHPVQTFDGRPAIQIQVDRADGEDLLAISEALDEYVDRRRERLPEGFEIDLWFDTAPILGRQMGTLRSILLQGLALVFVVLFFLLGPRLAFWVCLGIPVSLLGAAAILYLAGGTISLPSTFAMILVLGMIVDDAIVVGESIEVHFRSGKSAFQAAIDGAREVWKPVTSSSLTTVVAFLPAFYVSGQLGQMLRVIPIVVIGALFFSLIESLLILPNHLGHAMARSSQRAGRPPRLSALAERRIEWLFERVYRPVLDRTRRTWGLAIGGSVGLLLVAGAIVAGGHVGFVVFPPIDADYVLAQFELSPSAASTEVQAAARSIEAGAVGIRDAQDEPLVEHVSTTIGESLGVGGRRVPHAGQIVLALRRSTAGRTTTAEEVVAEWRRRTGEVSGVERLSFLVVGMTAAEVPIEVRLSGSDPERLRAASADLRASLAARDGLVDVVDDDRGGKLEFRHRLREFPAAAHGVTSRMLAHQLRHAFHGQTAVTVQDGRDEVDVVVILAESDRRRRASLEEFSLRTASGQRIPIGLVAERELVRTNESIYRVDQRRIVTITAGIDPRVANAEEVLGGLEDEGTFDEIGERYPGVEVYLEGQRGQARRSVRGLVGGLLAALFVIYAILSLTFRSLLQPVIVMSILPMSFFGAIVGHVVLAHDLSMLSLVGLAGLAGIVVNDSLILVEAINDQLAAGASFAEALVSGPRSRFRAILLTSSTTFIGLLPMMLERSPEARFLAPMAISVGFGVLFETVFVLLLVPAALTSANEGLRWLSWRRTGRLPAPEEVEPAVRRRRVLETLERDRSRPTPVPTELAALGPAAPPARRPTADATIDRAQAAQESDDRAATVAGYEAAVAREPDRADLRLQLGLALARNGDWQGASTEFDRAHRLAPEELDYRDLRGLAALRLGDHATALADFSSRLQSEPDHLVALKGRASAHLGLGRPGDALADLDHALGKWNLPDLYALRAETLRRIGQPRRAVADADKALAAEPTSRERRLLRARCLAEGGDADGALAAFDQILEANPRDAEILVDRGRTLLENDRAAEAVEALDLALTLGAPDEALYLRGRALAACGRASLAVEDLTAYLARSPDASQRGLVERMIRTLT